MSACLLMQGLKWLGLNKISKFHGEDTKNNGENEAQNSSDDIDDS